MRAIREAQGQVGLKCVHHESCEELDALPQPSVVRDQAARGQLFEHARGWALGAALEARIVVRPLVVVEVHGRVPRPIGAILALTLALATDLATALATALASGKTRFAWAHKVGRQLVE